VTLNVNGNPTAFIYSHVNGNLICYEQQGGSDVYASTSDTVNVDGTPEPNMWRVDFLLPAGITVGGVTGPGTLTVFSEEGDDYLLQWTGGTVKVMSGEEIIGYGNNSEASIGEEYADEVLNLVPYTPAPAPTHFQIRWEFASDIDVDGVLTRSVLGTIEPFSVGSVSHTEAHVIHHGADTLAAVCRIRYLQADEQTLSGFAGEIAWETPTNPIDPRQENRVVGLPYASSHRIGKTIGTMFDRLEVLNGSFVYGLKLVTINGDEPPIDEVVPPDGGWSDDGGGGAGWPQPGGDPIQPGEGVEPPTVLPPDSEVCPCSPWYSNIAEMLHSLVLSIEGLRGDCVTIGEALRYEIQAGREDLFGVIAEEGEGIQDELFAIQEAIEAIEFPEPVEMIQHIYSPAAVRAGQEEFGEA
jgi:hypothetical protein